MIAPYVMNQAGLDAIKRATPPKTYTEAEVRALVAAELQQAADRLFALVVDRRAQKKRAGNDYIAASARVVAEMIPTDHAAALEAVKAQALEHVARQFDDAPGLMFTGQGAAAAIRAGKVQP